METSFTVEELKLLKGILLNAKIAAATTQAGSVNSAMSDYARKLSELLNKVTALAAVAPSVAGPTDEVEPDLWVSEQHGQLVAIPGYETPDRSVYPDWQKANYIA